MFNALSLSSSTLAKSAFAALLLGTTTLVALPTAAAPRHAATAAIIADNGNGAEGDVFRAA